MSKNPHRSEGNIHCYYITMAGVNNMAKRQADIEKIIQKAVKAGIEAGRKQAERAPVDTYRATERRLYALPTLLKKIQDAKEKLQELEEHGLHERSKDVVRFCRSGQRLSSCDIAEAMMLDIRADIAADEHEIDAVKKALEQIEDDAYYLAVSGRYFKQITDSEIARQIPCDERTVRRHRGRLVRVVAVWLYGAEAV